MSSMFSKPKVPDIPVPEKIESVKKVRDTSSSEQQRVKRRLSATSGRQSSLLAGIQNALKRRLGE